MSLLGIDVGTTMCKAAVFSAEGQCLASAGREYNILHPTPFRAELDSNEVWAKVQQVIAQVVAAAAGDPVTALCIGSMGEALVPVTRDRQILANSILCFDERGQEYADALARDFSPEAFYRINANLIGPQFGLPKLLWLRDHERSIYDRADHLLPWCDLVAYMLGTEPCISNSQGCRTLLLDVGKGDWSPRLLDWAQVPREKLGKVVPGGALTGTVSPAMADRLGLGRNVQIVAGGHDQCCTALGCGCIEPGMAMCGMGTFQCIAPIFAKPADPLAMLRASLNIEHHTLPNLYVSFLYNQAGSLVKWFRDTFAADATDADVYGRLNAELPTAPTNLLVLPHFEPPVWPTHIPNTAGAILGLRTTTTRGDILKAIMECASLYFAPGIASLAQMGMPLRSLVAVGGGARSDAWLQINADILGVPVTRPGITEAGLLGAAMLAGLATGAFASASEAAKAFIQPDRSFTPDADRHAFYRQKSARLERVYPAISHLLGK